MNCQDFRRQVHAFLDAELPAREMLGMEEHRVQCHQCRVEFEVFDRIRNLVAARTSLPPAAASAILHEVSANRVSWKTHALDLLDRVSTYWRDLDPISVWTKVSALPVTVCFFMLFLLHFSPERIERLAMLAVATAPAGHVQTIPVVRSIEMRQSRKDFKLMIDTAWRLPFEDSLSIVAEIRADGQPQVDSVLEYPRSGELLTAVTSALHGSRIDSPREMSGAWMIFSFQKIDVYGEMGL